MAIRKAERTGEVHPVEGEEAEALQLAETSDLSLNQARELIRRHGHDRRRLEEAVRNYKAES